MGSHLIEYQNLLSNRINSETINQSGGVWKGASNSRAFYTRKIDLMSEVNVYGTIDTSSSLYDTGLDNQQYALFHLKPEFKCGYGTKKFSTWLKDVAGYNGFVHASGYGMSGFYKASGENMGVRPRFLVG